MSDKDEMVQSRRHRNSREWIAAGVAVCLCFLTFAAGIAVFPAPVAAEEETDDFGLTEADPDLPMKIAKWNADCLSCHSPKGLTDPPRQGMDLALLAKLLIGQDRFEHSDHGKMACKDCHQEAYVPYPHLANAKKGIKGCVECHQNPAKTIQPEFKSSGHFKEHSDRFTCLSCHDSHTMRKASRLETAHLAAAQDNAMCLTCHDDDARYKALKPGGTRPEMTAVHDWLPQYDRHLAATRCVDCHSPVADVGPISHEVRGKDKTSRNCGTCHAGETELGRRLYKRMLLDKPGAEGGFANAALLTEVYVVGANRNAWLEWGAAAALALTALGLAGSALWRRFKRVKTGSV
ncbi:cytochrome c3 family protein [Skermanella stibiiresistens]|nr:cytochrome c3 family protein [Skermanella stibiiresistens]